MGCMIALFLFLSPRLLMFAIFVFTNWFSQSFSSCFSPVLGFLFLPYTSLAYMWAMIQTNSAISGFWIITILFAFIIDVFSSKVASIAYQSGLR